jgi:hypothetical protein
VDAEEDQVTDVSETFRRIRQTRAGGRTERCHGIPHQGSYSNAQHQWGVAMLMHALWPEDFPRLALHCLSHDVPEAWVGDMPATTKRYSPGMREQLTSLEDRIQRDLGLPEDASLGEDDAEKVRSCDHLELYIWGREQSLMGNKFVHEMLRELEKFFEERPFRFPEAAGLYELLLDAPDLALLPAQARVIRDLCREP